MVDALSPLGAAWKPGRHERPDAEAGVTLSELRPGSIVQVAAWPGLEPAAVEAIRRVTNLAISRESGSGVVMADMSAFGFAPGRFLVVTRAGGTAAALGSAFPTPSGTVLDLSHGRIALRVAGPSTEWVLSKLFAIDFATEAFPVGAGRSTVHHDVFAQIQRSAPDAFDLYVFRSFARSFWNTLCHASDEVGYAVT